VDESLVTKPARVFVVTTLNHSSATLGLHRTIRMIYVVCIDNVRSGSELMTKARNHVRRKITPEVYWHQARCMSEPPKAVFSIDVLPRNVMGKVLKHELRQMLADEMSTQAGLGAGRKRGKLAQVL
jgi:acyl-coenzyme A synthetase/AMP-(fatty) acid ligase